MGMSVHYAGHHPLAHGIDYVYVRRVSGIVIVIDAHDFAVLDSNIANRVQT